MSEGVVSTPNHSTHDVSPRGRNRISDPAVSLVSAETTEPASTEPPSTEPSSPKPADSATVPEELPQLDGSAGSPDEVWNDYFSKRTPDAQTVHDLVARLNDAGKHDHVVAVIRAALRHGQGQPWMYEVLVLSLKIQRAPQEEIERALLSQVDFSATDPDSLMISAAYLARFDAGRPALRLYRQASAIAPQRAEPYLLGLKHAVALEDDDALAWAVRGTFATAWADDRQTQQRTAEDAINNRIRALRRKGETAAADSLTAVLSEAKQVDLVVRLEWSGDGALDLVVREPNGTVCSFDDRRTTGGGVLAHDGHGPDQGNCYEEYVCAAGFPGIYRVEVRHGWGEIVGKRARLSITRHRGTPFESTRTLTVPVTDEGETVRVTLTSGRRFELLTVPDKQSPGTEPVRREPLSSLVAPLDPAQQVAAKRFQHTLFRQVGGGVGGVSPVVGNGVVAYQPTVTVIPDGITLNASAVVSGDRRYVRLSLQPSFTEVIDVFRFTFVTTPN